jgi:hypothetical protein
MYDSISRSQDSLRAQRRLPLERGYSVTGLRLRSALLLCAALMLTATMAAPAVAATKPYKVVFSPAPPASIPGGQASTVSATITNLNTQQQLGSANLTPPKELKVNSVSPGAPKASVSPTGVVQLRNLGLAPAPTSGANGGSFTVQINVTPTVSCPYGTYAWSVLAKQANDFNGPPGNDGTLDASKSQLNTKVSGACSLRWSVQPKNARVNETITGDAYSPSSANKLQVQVLNGDGSVATGSTAQITVELGNAGGATLSGTTAKNASAGVATFDDLKVNRIGTYTLIARGTNLGSAQSNSFIVDETAERCEEDKPCDNIRSTADTVGKVTASDAKGANNDAGFLVQSVRPGLQPCGGQQFSRDWFGFDFRFDPGVIPTTGRAKTITETVYRPATDLSGLTAAAVLQRADMCFAAPYTFTVKDLAGGGTEPAERDPSTGEYSGLLPRCPNPEIEKNLEPCISGVTTGICPITAPCPLGYSVIITAWVPANLQDPRYG